MRCVCVWGGCLATAPCRLLQASHPSYGVEGRFIVTQS